MGELAVIGKFIDPKINRFVLGLISQAARDERSDHRNHPVDVLLIGGGGEVVCPFDPQSFDVVKKCLLERRSKFLERNFSFACAADRFVVHIGDVHDAMDFVTAQFEMTLQEVFEDVSAKVANVRAAVNRRPAGVDVDLAVLYIARLKFFELARVGFKKTQRHQLGRDPAVAGGRPFLLRRSRRSRPTNSTVAIAIAAMPSLRPIAPSRSFVVALMLMFVSEMPIVLAIFCRIAETCGAILGASTITVASTFTMRVFFSASIAVTRFKISMLLMSRSDSSVFGKCWPISPAQIAPSSASAIACDKTSPSECPSSPSR